MSVSRAGFFGLAALMATLPALAEAQANPFANAEKLGTLSMEDGSVLNCSKTKAGDPKRKNAIERQFSRLEFDACLWESKVDDTRSLPSASLYRTGVDVSCTLQEVQAQSIAEPDDQMLMKQLASMGLVEVTMISSHAEHKFGGLLIHQVVRGQMTQGNSPYRPFLGIRTWIWAGSHRMTTLICVAPYAVMDTEASRIDAVGDSMTIKPTAFD
jgi:hypothetical protein